MTSPAVQLQSVRSDATATVLILCAAVVAFGAFGCHPQPRPDRQTVDAMAKATVAVERESDPVFARRAIPANLKIYEARLIDDPENERLLRLLAKGYFSYAFRYLQHDLAHAEVKLEPESKVDELANRAVLHYERSRDYGFRLLDRPELEEAARSLDVEALRRRLAQLGEEDVPGLFWAGRAWGAAVNLAPQDPAMREAAPVVKAMMERVEELDDNYHDAGVHVFFGVYYASRPTSAEGDPEKAKRHFSAAMERFGDENLMIPFLYGRFYGAQTQNRELFERMMQKVTAADLSAYPERRLNNEIAARRARFWSRHADVLFEDDERSNEE